MYFLALEFSFLHNFFNRCEMMFKTSLYPKHALRNSKRSKGKNLLKCCLAITVLIHYQEAYIIHMLEAMLFQFVQDASIKLKHLYQVPFCILGSGLYRHRPRETLLLLNSILKIFNAESPLYFEHIFPVN